MIMHAVHECCARNYSLQMTNLTTQMLCLSCSVLLLTPLRGVGVDGPSARRVPGLLTAMPLKGLGGPPALPGVDGARLAGLGDIGSAPLLMLLPVTDCRLALADLAAFAARTAAASSTSAATTSSTSSCT